MQHFLAVAVGSLPEEGPAAAGSPFGLELAGNPLGLDLAGNPLGLEIAGSLPEEGSQLAETLLSTLKEHHHCYFASQVRASVSPAGSRKTTDQERVEITLCACPENCS